MSDLDPARIVSMLANGLGRPYLYLASTRSTQDLLRDSDHPHGAVAVAEHQTAGRGRSGRRWDAAEGEALLCSILLRLPPQAPPPPQLSLVAGLAVAAAIEDLAGVAAVVKWPNDVLVEGRKLSGILLEAAGATVVCGIGINVNQGAASLPAATRLPATSLRIACGRPFDRGVLLAALLQELERRYTAWLAGGLPVLAAELDGHHALRGREVVVDARVGRAGPITRDGRLEVEFADGSVALVESGEVDQLSR